MQDINVVVGNVPVGSRIIDSLPFSQGGTSIQAAALRADAVDGVVGYLGAMNRTRLEYVLGAGMGFMPVTFAGAYKNAGGAKSVAQLKALGVLPGTTVWLDVEGKEAWDTPPAQLMALIDAWNDPVIDAGYIPGLYVGAPQPLNGAQLYALKSKRYWLGQGRCVGRDGLDAYPRCGWCMRQDWHGEVEKMGLVWRRSGVLVDTNGVQKDHFNRLPTWMVAA
jgi:hypothetical protein